MLLLFYKQKDLAESTARNAAFIFGQQQMMMFAAILLAQGASDLLEIVLQKNSLITLGFGKNFQDYSKNSATRP